MIRLAFYLLAAGLISLPLSFLRAFSYSAPPAHLSESSFDSSRVANGLRADYYNGRNFDYKVASRVDPQIDFEFDKGGLPPGINANDFSVRWVGKVFAPVAGVYTLVVHADDGVRIWMGGKLVMDEWRWQGETVFKRKILLKAQQYYDLKVEYYNYPGFSVIRVAWESPEQESSLLGRPTAVIPNQYLFPTQPAAPPTPPVVAKAKLAPLPASLKTAAPKAVTVATNRRKKEVHRKAPPVSTPASPTTPSTPEAETFERLERGQSIVLRHVLFEQSRYTFVPDSYAELDKLVKTLLKNPHVQIEIAGHTDDQGDPRLNQVLSENRAKVIASYLFRHGIAQSRIQVKGYGSSQPLADNGNEIDRAKNRRVEFRIK